MADYALDEYVIARCGDVGALAKKVYEDYEHRHRDMKRYGRERERFMKEKWSCLQKYHDHLLV